MTVIGRHTKLWTGRTGYDESAATAALDKLLASPELLARMRQAGGLDAVFAALAELHRARRFYERPESQQPFQARPTPGATRPKLSPPAPDFHERLSLVNDHPELLRALGLVIDLRVEERELNRLAHAQWITGRIEPAAPFASAQLPPAKTLVKTAGRALVTVPAGQDIRDGRLRLGDETRFAVLDLDPDASALKLDRFLWTLPRLALLEQKGEPGHAAPPTLRATGLTVVRSERASLVQQRVQGAATLEQEVTTGGATLHTEDLLRGYRVEVFDDSALGWRSLHERRSEIRVGPTKKLPSEAPGFVRTGSVSETPGVADSPLYVHEALFGWEGWSLSAPYPGRSLHHVGGNEVFDPAQSTAAPTPVHATHQVAPGTLPRLRYGRTYAFRAWTVDLAGNSVPHAMQPLSTPQLLGVSAAILRAQPLSADAEAPWLASARSAVSLPAVAATAVTLGPPEPVREPPTEPARTALSAHPDLESLLRERGALRAEALRLRGVEPTRRERITRTLGRALSAGPLVTTTSSWSAERLAATAHLDAGASLAGTSLEDTAKLTLDTVSRPRPFLRWEPVAPPVLVARRRYTEGESLLRLVVRSDVTVGADGTVTVTPMAATSERHLAPPKTTQNEAERHGVFDFALGSQNPAEHERAFRIALRESGTLMDTSVPDLSSASVQHVQEGLAVAGPPGAPPIELAGWPRGEALPQGRYVVHDTDRLRVPWLPDPLAAGLTLGFPDANQDRAIRWPRNIESMSVRYRGEYPEIVPYRLVLDHGAALGARVQGDAIRVSLAPADTLRVLASSRLSRTSLNLMGLWRMLPEGVRKEDELVEAAAEGWLWALTPFEQLTLVHAVPRPLALPKPVLLLPAREPGSATVTLVGALECHGASTERLDVEAEWTDVTDDLNLAGPEQQDMTGHAFGFGIAPDEDLVVLFGSDGTVGLPVLGPVHTHKAEHALGDPRHRVIKYRFRATTRFREYFAAESYTAERPPYVESPPHTLSVPASAPPASPEIASALPLFNWVEGPEPEQPFAWRRTRRVGIRLYLERPWYSSGAGEQLAVLIAGSPGTKAPATMISTWGADPAWFQRGPAYRTLLMKHEDFVQLGGLDRAAEPAGPARPPVVVAIDGQPVVALPYEPSYHAERQLWQVDIGIAAGAALWPFVRLCVARYQAEALPGCSLSRPVQCDFTQLPPERAFTLARPDDRTARVVVSGPVGVNQLGWKRRMRTNAAVGMSWEEAKEAVDAGRRLLARLERREGASDSDLAWREVASVPLELSGYDMQRGNASWVGALALPEPLAIVQPGRSNEWRVTVEEIEMMPADPAPGGPDPGTEERVVYADTIPL